MKLGKCAVNSDNNPIVKFEHGQTHPWRHSGIISESVAEASLAENGRKWQPIGKFRGQPVSVAPRGGSAGNEVAQKWANGQTPHFLLLSVSLIHVISGLLHVVINHIGRHGNRIVDPSLFSHFHPPAAVT